MTLLYRATVWCRVYWRTKFNAICCCDSRHTVLQSRDAFNRHCEYTVREAVCYESVRNSKEHANLIRICWKSVQLMTQRGHCIWTNISCRLASMGGENHEYQLSSRVIINKETNKQTNKQMATTVYRFGLTVQVFWHGLCVRRQLLSTYNVPALTADLPKLYRFL